jgi:hypothetical protein
MFDDLLRAQDDLVTRRQSLLFMTQSALTARLGRDWQVVLPGVYATFTGPLSPRHKLRAALLHAGPQAMLTDSTLLALQRLPYLPPDPCVRVLVPAEVQVTSRDFVVVRRTVHLPMSRQLHGFPVAPLSRALVDFVARHPDERAAFAVVAAAIQQRRLRLSDLIDELATAPNRGKPKVVRSIEQLAGGLRSAAELDFRGLVVASEVLPEPLWNCLLRLPGGELISPDGLWILAALIHEVNGRRYHADDNGQRDLFDDMQVRHDLLVTAGFTVLHNAPRRVLLQGRTVIQQVETCFLRERGKGLPPGVEIVRAAAA